jgi:hypothetical protein
LLANTINLILALAIILFAVIGKIFKFSEWLEKYPNIKRVAESGTTYVVLLIVAILLLAGVFQNINAVREALNVPPPSPKAPSTPVLVVKEEPPAKPVANLKLPPAGKVKQGGTGDCQANAVGGNANVENSCNTGPPPLVLRVVSVKAGTSVMAFMPKEGFIQTDITIVPNQEVTAPFTIELDFDNPISDIAHTVKDVGAQMGGGPFRIGIHARETVSTSIGPSHPLIVAVFSLQPVKLVGDPRIVF